MSSSVLIVAPFTDGAGTTLLLPSSATQVGPNSIALGAVMYGSAAGTNPVQGERILALLDNADAVSPSTDFDTQFGFLGTVARNTLYNENDDQWNRTAGIRADTDGSVGAEPSAQLCAALAFARNALSGNDELIRIGGLPAVPISADPSAGSALLVASFPYLYLDEGGGLSARQSSGSFASLGLRRSETAAMVTGPGEAAIPGANNFAAATAAIATAAASGSATVINVCRAISVSLVTVAIQAPLRVVLRDGASGVGAILWSGAVSAPAGGSAQIHLPGLCIVGSGNTAMTLETVGAPAAGNVVEVTLIHNRAG